MYFNHCVIKQKLNKAIGCGFLVVGIGRATLGVGCNGYFNFKACDVGPLSEAFVIPAFGEYPYSSTMRLNIILPLR